MRPTAVKLTLADTREVVAEAVGAMRACGDGNVHYFNGLDLIVEADKELIEDHVYPNVAGYKLLGRRFASQVMGRLLGPSAKRATAQGWLREKKASSKIPGFRPVSPPGAPCRFMRRTRVSKSAFGTAGLYPVSDPFNQCAWCDSSLMCQSFETKSSSLVANSNQARNSATREGCINMPFSL